MKMRIILLFTVTVTLLAACDLFNPQTFYDAVDNFNSTENNADSNYWRRYFLSGDELDYEFGYIENNIIADNIYYCIHSTVLTYQLSLFTAINLETFEVKTLTMPDLSDLDSFYLNGSYNIGSDIVLEYYYFNNADSTSMYRYLRYSSGSGIWDEITDSLNIPEGSMLGFITCSDRYFIKSGSSVYEYTDGSFILLETFNTSVIYLSNDNRFILRNSALDTVWEFNFGTDSFDEISLTYNLESPEDSYSDSYFLTSTNIICNLRFDEVSSSEDSLDYDPVLLDYVDLGGDLTCKRVEYSDNPELGAGDSVSSVIYKDDIYFFTSAWDDTDESYELITDSLYRFNSNSLQFEIMDTFPLGSDDGIESYFSRSVNNLFVMQFSSYDYSATYIYNADGVEGFRWIEVPDIAEGIFGYKYYAGSLPENHWYNGKYYRAETSYRYSILEYTPPAL